MAAIRRGNLGCLVTNLSNYFAKNGCNINRNQQRLFHLSRLLYESSQEIKMPSLSPTMAEGKIVKWLKKEGDVLTPGDILCDIETDKAVVSLEVEDEGILAKIIVPENTANVKVGSLIALTVEDGEDWTTVKLTASVEAAAPPSDSASGSSSSSSSSSSGEGDEVSVKGPPSSVLIKMPSLSPTMTSGTIIKWLKKEGDTVAAGDVLCDIQTDKAVMSLEAEEEGILAKILLPDDSKDVKVGTIIAVVVPEGEDWKNVTVTRSAAAKKQETAPVAPSPPSGEAIEVRGKSYGPAVKALLSSYQLDPSLIKATGKNNRLLKEDVTKYIEDNKLLRKPPKAISAPTPSKELPKPSSKAPKTVTITPAAYIDIELTNIRKIIAKRLQESKLEIPHAYTSVECEVKNLIGAKSELSTGEFKVSVNDLITKAVGQALQMYPKANANVINQEVKLLRNVDVCIAVATDNGLFTPIIRNTNLKSVLTIASEIKDLAGRAKKGKLKPQEYQGGTFTISNLGMFGITHFKAIINPPQCGLIAVGGKIDSFDSDLKPRSYIILTLSYDRRALEEDEAAEFMMVVKHVIENPKLITLDVNQNALKMGL